jgi:hypothetical protein
MTSIIFIFKQVTDNDYQYRLLNQYNSFGHCCQRKIFNCKKIRIIVYLNENDNQLEFAVGE